MRFLFVTMVVGLLGCGGSHSNGKADAATDGAAGDALDDGGADRGSSDALPSADAPTSETAAPACADPLPACLADLRKGCRLPVVAQGTCKRESNVNEVSCFSNGVRVIVYPNRDAGAGHDIKLTLPDGTTTCYLEDVPGDGTLSFFSAAGALVGKLTYLPDGGATVTCTGGQPVQVSQTDLRGGASGACAAFPLDQCTDGTCP